MRPVVLPRVEDLIIKVLLPADTLTGPCTLCRKHATHLKAARAELMIKHEVEMAQLKEKVSQECIEAQTQFAYKKEYGCYNVANTNGARCATAER